MTTKENWEEELGRLEIPEGRGGSTSSFGEHQIYPDIKAFISNLLTQERERIVREIEGLSDRAHTYSSENSDLYHAYDNGFDECKKRAIQIIKGE